MATVASSAELLVSTRDVLAVRLAGRPRDPESGQHKKVVVYCETSMQPVTLAAFLRDAADRLELLGPV